MRKPYYWKARSAWYVKSPDGRRIIFLHTDESAAHAVWRECYSSAGPSRRERTAAERLHKARLARAKRVKRRAAKLGTKSVLNSPTPRQIAERAMQIRQQRGLVLSE